MTKMVNSFYSIFKDGNDWNEKSIIGFMAFAVMVLFAIVDLVTGFMGKELIISDTIYSSFVWVTLGSFGINGIEKFAGPKKLEE